MIHGVDNGSASDHLTHNTSFCRPRYHFPRYQLHWYRRLLGYCNNLF